MSWPSVLPNSAAFDADADSVAASRPELKKMSDAVNTMASNVYTAGSTTGTITPDVANGEIQRITLTGNITMNAFANPVTGQRLTMIFKQPAAGSTFDLTSNMLWENGLESLTQINSAVDTADIVYDGTNYFARMNLAHGSVEVYNFGSEVVDDTTPQLGGNLDLNGFTITTSSTIAPASISLQTSNSLITDNDITITAGKSGGTQGQINLQTNTIIGDTRTTLPDTFNIITTGESLSLQASGTSTGGTILLNAYDVSNGLVHVQSGLNGDIKLDTSNGSGNIELKPNTGTIVCNDKILRQVEFKDYAETVYNQGNVTGSFSITVANGNTQRMRLTGNITFTGFADAREGQTITLLITQDGTGNRTFTEGLDSAGRMLFAGGVSTLSTTANSTDIMSISYIGGTYWGSINKNYS